MSSSYFARKVTQESHTCELPVQPSVLETFYPGGLRKTKFKRKLHSLTLASRKNPLALLFLKSHTAITAERVRQLHTFPYIIHPFSQFRDTWEIFMWFVFMVTVMQIPIFTAFHSDMSNSLKIYDLICDCLCLCDCLIVTFLSGYYDRNTKEVYLHPKMIARHYIFGFFIIDFLSAFPFEEFFEAGHGVATKLFLLQILKLMRIKSILKYFKQLVLHFHFSEISTIIIRFTIISAIFIQWISCGHYIVAYIAQLGNKHERSWIYATDIYSSRLWKKYIQTMFRGVSICFNVEFGTVKPHTTEDLLYTSFATLCGKVYTIFLITTCFEVFRVTLDSRAKYNEMLKQVKEFMSYKHLPRTLQQQIYSYYEYRFQKKYFREAEILNTLTGHMREEVILHSCRRLLEKVEFFNNLPIQLLIRIATCLRCEIYLTNDVIVKTGSPGDAMYFIASGTLSVYTDDGSEIIHLDDGGHFGEVALVKSGVHHISNVVAIERCEIFQLSRRDFRLAVAPYPALVTHLKSLAEERLPSKSQLLLRRSSGHHNLIYKDKSVIDLLMNFSKR